MRSAQVTVRMATIDDAEALRHAVLAIANTLSERRRVISCVADFRRHGFGDNPVFDALIAKCCGAYVQDLHVRSERRGLGIGAKLLRHLAALTRRRGGAYLRLSVGSDNVAAQSFYARLGIRHVSGEHIHSVHGDDFAALADAGNDLLEQP